MANYQDFIKIARPDHWIKNLFVLPGVALALFFLPDQSATNITINVLLALLATCIVSSSNYVINEILDATYDIYHPEKKHRPLAAGRVLPSWAYVEWILLGIIGIALGFFISELTGWALLILWVAGLLYNVPPIRTKEIPYLDVISEASNNPIRLAIGWYATGIADMPPISALFAYWMFGSFLMATKRFAEFRRIGDEKRAAQYRRSFAFYNEERLVVGIVFYIALFITGASVFIMQYRYELIFGMPFLAYMCAYYLYLGFQNNSPVQYPELLYREKHLMSALLLCAIFCLVLFFVDFPIVEKWFIPLAVN